MTNPILQVTTTSGQVLPVLGDAQGRVLVTGGNVGPAGPTGPTGADSTVPGPAGPTGATGAASTVPGPAGADSTVPGPTGPTGATGATGAVDTSTAYTWSAEQNFSSTQTYPRIPANTQSSAYTLVLSDAGKVVLNSSGGVTVPASIFSAGDVISVYNNSASDIALNQGGSVTMYKAGSATTGNQLIAQRGIGVVLCVASNQFVCSGVK